MIQKTMENGKPAYGLCEFRCDFEKDVETLPKDCLIGSIAYVIENGKVFMLSSEGWKEI